MEKTQTLFSRYKQMINTMWADGQRKYTANDLNFHVAAYENQTWWKRSNNNECYTTRLYQTALKHLGCVTKIKRGLWQINGPIPEWFGSFHINALKSKSALQELERSSIYWKSLPAEHKVNPWKNIDPMRVVASMQEADLLRALEEADNAQMEDDIAGGMRNCGDFDYYTQETINTNKQTMENETTNNGMVISEPGIMLSNTVSFTTKTPSGLELECKAWINLWNTDEADKPWDGECSDLEIFLPGNRAAKYAEVNATLITLHGKEWFDCFVKECEEKSLAHALETHKHVTFPAQPKVDAVSSVVDNTQERRYTMSEIVKALSTHLDNLQESLTNDISSDISSIDDEDLVELDFDNYSRKIDVSINHSVIEDTATDSIESVINSYKLSDRIAQCFFNSYLDEENN